MAGSVIFWWNNVYKSLFKKTQEKQFHHRGHREKLCIVSNAEGVVNKVKLCVSVVKCLAL